MDPRLVRGIVVLVALAAYVAVGGVPPDFETFMQHVSLFVLGGVAIRRPGDLEPIHDDAP